MQQATFSTVGSSNKPQGQTLLNVSKNILATSKDMDGYNKAQNIRNQRQVQQHQRPLLRQEDLRKSNQNLKGHYSLKTKLVVESKHKFKRPSYLQRLQYNPNSSKGPTKKGTTCRHPNNIT